MLFAFQNASVHSDKLQRHHAQVQEQGGGGASPPGLDRGAWVKLGLGGQIMISGVPHPMSPPKNTKISDFLVFAASDTEKFKMNSDNYDKKKCLQFTIWLYLYYISSLINCISSYFLELQHVNRVYFYCLNPHDLIICTL